MSLVMSEPNPLTPGNSNANFKKYGSVEFAEDTYTLFINTSDYPKIAHTPGVLL